jgi:hypothetical protein
MPVRPPRAILRARGMQVRTVDDRSTAALAQWLREHDCAVYEPAWNELDVSPLGSLNADLAAPELAQLLQAWLAQHPGAVLVLDPRS